MLRHVIIPGALPIIFSGLRLALGTALIVVVAVEFIRSQTGVGFLVFSYWQVLVVEKMYAGLFVGMALGVGLTYAAVARGEGHAVAEVTRIGGTYLRPNLLPGLRGAKTALAPAQFALTAG